MKIGLLLGLIGACLSLGIAFAQEKTVTTKSGLKYVDLMLGTGEEAKAGKTVTVNCTSCYAAEFGRSPSEVAALSRPTVPISTPGTPMRRR
jgi:hypothetical protein